MNATKLKLAALAAIAALASTGGGFAGLTSAAHAAEAKAPAAAAVALASVRYGDLNLRTPAGVQRLNARIRATAERLCYDPGVKGLQAEIAANACRDAIIAGVAPQVRAAAGVEAYADASTLARGR